MRGRVFTVVFDVSVSAAQDFLELTSADDKPIEIVGVHFAQKGVSDFGDANEEGQRWSVVRGNTTSGSGGSAPTPQPVKPNSGAASFTAEVNNTTAASSGTAVTLHEGSFNVRIGETFWFPEGCEPGTNQGAGLLCVRVPAPADAITLVGTIYVRETD